MATILVTDNDQDILSLYQQELLAEGYPVLLAKNGDEALEKVRSHQIDLVILDIEMEGKGGLETLREILSEKRNIKVILNTAYNQFMDDFSSWAADAFVVKSSNLDPLKKHIEALLGK
ncbi:MAG: response regulator [Candidatus Latescibacterota bacterium]